jgi:hypothetical protein
MNSRPSVVSVKWSWAASTWRNTARKLVPVTMAAWSAVTMRTGSPHIAHHARTDAWLWRMTVT